MGCLGFLAILAFKWFGDKSGNIDKSAVRLYDKSRSPFAGCVIDYAAGSSARTSRPWRTNPLEARHFPNREGQPMNASITWGGSGA